ncbi:hypothetical protein F4861DRAFT_523381 [Xylaria intraflava]|nr:hypothetical protein F4861DRAFT_523381 [Xylaria intraflava]
MPPRLPSTASKERRLLAAIGYFREHPHTTKREVARIFNIPCPTFYGRLRDIGAYTPLARSAGPNSAAEEKAICTYIDYLEQGGIVVLAGFIAKVAASAVRARADPSDSAPTIAGYWLRSFARRNGYFVRTQERPMLDLVASGDVEAMARRFEALREIIAAEGILSKDMWQMRDASYLLGKGRLIITRKEEAGPSPDLEAPEETRSQVTRSPSPADIDEPLVSSPVNASGAAAETPSGPAGKSSIKAKASTTIRSVREAGYEIQRMLDESDDLDPQFARSLGQLIKNFILDATNQPGVNHDSGGNTSSAGRVQKRGVA